MATPHDDPAPPEPEDITTADLDLIDRLDREATPGPWEVSPNGNVWGPPSALRTHDQIADVDPIGDTGKRREDAALIAAARTLLPRLARAYRGLLVNRDVYREAAERRLGMFKDAKIEADAAYARGRREAIEEAVEYLRAESNHVGRVGCAAEIEANEKARGGQS